MKRREFIKNTSLASSLVFVPSFVKAFDEVLKFNSAFKRLVIIQLSGGNDGLNTIVPFRNDIYYRSRPKLAIPKNTILKLNDELGVPKILSPLKRLYDQGYLSVINNVGYPNPDRSHFRSTDIWQTASGSSEYLSSGWIGRFLDMKGNSPHDAIEVNDSLSLALKGERLNGIATKDAKRLYNLSKHPYFKALVENYNSSHLSEHNLGYLYKTMIETESSAEYIYEKTKTTQPAKGYTGHPFGKQLKTTSEFIKSGLDTRVYYTSMGGYDTHANQHTTQSKLLEVFSRNLEIFVKDLDKQGNLENTLILVFSEFGRRVEQNGANGTDHGAANNVFILGKNLKTPGIYNELGSLSDLDENGDLKYEIDFRSIYSTILKNWMMVDEELILGQPFQQLKLV